MQQLIIDFLARNWNADHAAQIQFAPVPKGKSGDLAMNFFALTKVLGQSPIEIGQTVGEILENLSLVEKTEAAGPYLNLFFSAEAFFASVMMTEVKTKSLLNKNIVLEFSGPNTNKPLHLGHMRNHALGISVGNTLEAAGANVHRVNIINDRGVHICKSMLAYQLFGNGETPESTGEKSDEFVGRYYVKFNTESQHNPDLNDEVQKMLIKWEDGDPEVRKIWEMMNGWTLAGHAETYRRQGVVFEKSYYESNTYELGRKFALKGLEEGDFYKKDGAVWVDLTDHGLDEKIIIRSDGTTVYVTQDLATTYQRYEDFSFDEHIWVVANEQEYHFKVLINCLDKLGLCPKEKLHHLSYGLVNLPGGRMKSREGTVVDADNLMDQLHDIAAEKIKSNQVSLEKGDIEGSWTEAEIYKTSEQVQNAAWKFYLLRTSPNKAITFDAEKSIDFHGATGPYLQYAGVRIKSILQKSGKPLSRKPDLSPLGDAEKPLGVKILEWPDVLDRAAEHYNSTYIVTYLLELAQEWSSFYASNSILKANNEDLKDARLILAAKVLQVLETGLNILGIEVPERM